MCDLCNLFYCSVCSLLLETFVILLQFMNVLYFIKGVLTCFFMECILSGSKLLLILIMNGKKKVTVIHSCVLKWVTLT